VKVGGVGIAGSFVVVCLVELRAGHKQRGVTTVVVSNTSAAVNVMNCLWPARTPPGATANVACNCCEHISKRWVTAVGCTQPHTHSHWCRANAKNSRLGIYKSERDPKPIALPTSACCVLCAFMTAVEKVSTLQPLAIGVARMPGTHGSASIRPSVISYPLPCRPLLVVCCVLSFFHNC
jgi:hypothetical protein